MVALGLGPALPTVTDGNAPLCPATGVWSNLREYEIAITEPAVIALYSAFNVSTAALINFPGWTRMVLSVSQDQCCRDQSQNIDEAMISSRLLLASSAMHSCCFSAKTQILQQSPKILNKIYLLGPWETKKRHVFSIKTRVFRNEGTILLYYQTRTSRENVFETPKVIFTFPPTRTLHGVDRIGLP